MHGLQLPYEPDMASQFPALHDEMHIVLEFTVQACEMYDPDEQEEQVEHVISAATAHCAEIYWLLWEQAVLQYMQRP